MGPLLRAYSCFIYWRFILRSQGRGASISGATFSPVICPPKRDKNPQHLQQVNSMIFAITLHVSKALCQRSHFSLLWQWKLQQHLDVRKAAELVDFRALQVRISLIEKTLPKIVFAATVLQECASFLVTWASIPVGLNSLSELIAS